MDIDAYLAKLTEACDHYEKTAPVVRDHCDDLYIRINESPDRVTLAELNQVAALWSDDWMHPNYAANHVYRLRSRFGMDTTGLAGF